MKAERIKLEPEFVPVIVTLESQEEVDALYAVVDHTTIQATLPVLNDWQGQLYSFRSSNYAELWKKLDMLIRS